MILFDLKCANDHQFEAWFQDSAAFDDQTKAGELTCPVCGDAAIEKALMAPSVTNAKKKGGNAAKAAVHAGQYIKALGELRKHVEENCEHVGDKFAEEARKIHYGESDARNIYGEATEQESTNLKDEGVEFERIPWTPTHDA